MGISLLSLASKSHAGLILDRLFNTGERSMCEKQVGFRPGWHCIYKSYIPQEILEHKRTFLRFPISGIFDLKAMFDSTNSIKQCIKEIPVNHPISDRKLSYLEYASHAELLSRDSRKLYYFLRRLNDSVRMSWMRFSLSKCEMSLQDWNNSKQNLVLARRQSMEEDGFSYPELPT